MKISVSPLHMAWTLIILANTYHTVALLAYQTVDWSDQSGTLLFPFYSFVLHGCTILSFVASLSYPFCFSMPREKFYSYSLSLFCSFHSLEKLLMHALVSKKVAAFLGPEGSANGLKSLTYSSICQHHCTHSENQLTVIELQIPFHWWLSKQLGAWI